MRSARGRPRALTRNRRYPTDSCGAADGCLAGPGHRGSGGGWCRNLFAHWFVDTDRRRAGCRGAVRSCLVASCRSVDPRPVRCAGRRTRDARTRRLFCGRASIRTQANPDSTTLVNPHQSMSHSPRKGCGFALPSRCLVEAPSRVVDKSTRLQTAGKGNENDSCTRCFISARERGSRRRPLGVPGRASSSLRHRISDAAQRSRRRGHRARRLGALADGRSPPGSRCRGVPRDDDDATGDQRHAVSTLAPGKVAPGPGCRNAVDTSPDPALGVERVEALELGVLALLKKLSPTERAAYILREAFDYTYRDIANVLRLEEANARQVVTRARQHVANDRRTPASATEHRRLLEAFIAATQDGDVAGLERVLLRDGGRSQPPRSECLATKPSQPSTD